MNQLQLHVIVILNKRARTDRSRRCNTWAKNICVCADSKLRIFNGQILHPPRWEVVCLQRTTAVVVESYKFACDWKGRWPPLEKSVQLAAACYQLYMNK